MLKLVAAPCCFHRHLLHSWHEQQLHSFSYTVLFNSVEVTLGRCLLHLSRITDSQIKIWNWETWFQLSSSPGILRVLNWASCFFLRLGVMSETFNSYFKPVSKTDSFQTDSLKRKRSWNQQEDFSSRRYRWRKLLWLILNSKSTPSMPFCHSGSCQRIFSSFFYRKRNKLAIIMPTDGFLRVSSDILKILVKPCHWAFIWYMSSSFTDSYDIKPF